MHVPDAGWRHLGAVARCQYYEAGARILAAWPVDKMIDTAETAAANSAYQRDHFLAQGAPGVVVIFFDRIAHQDRGAREVYTTRTTPDWACGIALIGGSMLTRALGSFFMGLSKPIVPTKMFADYEAAMPWILERLGRVEGAR